MTGSMTASPTCARAVLSRPAGRAAIRCWCWVPASTSAFTGVFDPLWQGPDGGSGLKIAKTTPCKVEIWLVPSRGKEPTRDVQGGRPGNFIASARLSGMPIEPPEIPPATPGQPTEPPREEPPGNPRPEVPPPAREPGAPPLPQELPGEIPDDLPVRGPNVPPPPSPAADQLRGTQLP